MPPLNGVSLPSEKKIPTPYYQSEGVTIYNCRWEEILPSLTGIDACITDPPYGISLRTDYLDRQRGSLTTCNNFKKIEGDNGEFDPTPFLEFKAIVLFGANYFSDRLPQGGWAVWDKIHGLPSKREIGFNDNSDAELIWTNRKGACRIFRHRWMGAMKGSEQQEARVHPTQKPVALMEMLVRIYTQPGDLVVDPFMGSRATLLACKKHGRRVIGIEVDTDYCKVTVDRLQDVESGKFLSTFKKQLKRRTGKIP